MKVIVDFCLIPLGTDSSLAPYIAECQKILQQLRLKHTLHAYGTNIEGEWDTVMDAVKRCHVRVHEMGVLRISTTIKLGTRTDRDQTLEEKVSSVETILDQG